MVFSKLSHLMRDPSRVVRSQLSLRLLPWMAPDSEARRIALWNYGKLPRVRAELLFPQLTQVEELQIHGAFQRKLDTSMDLNEVVQLVSLAKMIKARRVLEIGTFDGNTTLNLAANLEEGSEVVTVDLPPNWEGDYPLDVPSEHRNASAPNVVGRQFLASPLKARIRQVFGDSAKLDWGTLGGPFDLIFIDGCHAYDYVISDTRNALPQLAPGGLIAWHDYGYLEEVSRALAGFGDKLDMHVLSGTRLAVGQLRR